MRWLLPLALLHGLIYLVLVPPWEHYDEPSHFSYAAEIAAGELYARGPAAAAVSREVSDSMYRHGFMGGNFRPDLAEPGLVRVGENQRVHPPLAYAVMAAPLRLLRYLPVDSQLYVLRAGSVLLYGLTILATWRITAVVLPDEPQIQYVLTLMVLMHPAFADLMSAVNNDVLLNFALTTLLLGAVTMIRHGVSVTAVILMLLALAVAVAAKRTGVLGLVPATLALLWAIRREPLSLSMIGVGVALIALFGVALFEIRQGEAAGQWLLMVRPWFEQIDRLYLRLDLARLLQSLGDWERSAALYPTLVDVGFKSFWARFGWGALALPSLWDWTFLALVLGACVGLIVGAPWARRELPLWQRRSIRLFGVCVLVGCVSLLARLHPLPAEGLPVYIPRGRYLFWAVVPAVWLLALGLQWLVPQRWRLGFPWVLAGLFLLADLTAMVMIGQAFAGVPR